MVQHPAPGGVGKADILGGPGILPGSASQYILGKVQLKFNSTRSMLRIQLKW